MGSFAGIYPVQTFSSVKSSFFHPVLRRATILRHCQHPTKEISPSTLYTKTHFFDGGLKTIPWARRALSLPLLPLRRDLCVRDCLVCRHRKYSKKRKWNYTSTLTRIDNPELRREPVLDSVSSSFLDSGAAVCAGSAATCEYGLGRERFVRVCVCVCVTFMFSCIFCLYWYLSTCTRIFVFMSMVLALQQIYAHIYDHRVPVALKRDIPLGLVFARLLP